VEVRRNDALSVQDVFAMRPEAVLLSPGPCTPNEAGICLPLITAAAEARLPLMGVCLGHQAIGQAFGGDVIRAPEPVHGKVWEVAHDGSGIFAGIPSPFRATRYHSLVVDAATFPAALRPTAHTADGLVMGLEHRELPIWGVQFHPESIASDHGHAILSNFCRLARQAVPA
jgi:anthranilate synthase/aminodeoxychorismate synthase-like glutamine amidotransferase